MSEARIRKGYTDGPFGQGHWREAGEGARPDLVCLHPAPFTGVAFSTIMPHLARDRRVIVPDYPGHGGSVDLLGFHTGCRVAIELSLAHPDKIRRLALVDVPADGAEERATYLAMTARPFEIGPDIACLAPAWDRGIAKRIESQGIERSWEMFVETLRHGRRMNAAFHAGFTFDVDGQLPKVTHPTAVIASQSMLLEPSRRAARLIPVAELIERLNITRAVLDEAAEKTATQVLEFLNR